MQNEHETAACGLVSDVSAGKRYIVIAGGDPGGSIVELMDLETMTWTDGT